MKVEDGDNIIDFSTVFYTRYFMQLESSSKLLIVR